MWGTVVCGMVVVVWVCSLGVVWCCVGLCMVGSTVQCGCGGGCGIIISLVRLQVW